MFFRLLFVPMFISLSLFAEDAIGETTKVSEAFGNLIGKNLSSLGMDLDMELVVKGIKDAANGKTPLMTESEFRKALISVQAKNNLQSAETFLKENAKNKDVVLLEEGKVQYKIEKMGEGTKVEPNFSPLVRYVGKYLDGRIFGKSETAQILSLKESIPGFSKGLIGMREGEKRTLYIHPEFGYGTQEFLPPNSLLTFEIEVVKADSPEEPLSNSLIIESQDELKAPSDPNAPVIR